MMTEKCPDRETLTDLLLGRIAGPDKEALEVHFLGCENCATLAESLSGGDALTKALRKGRPIEKGDEILATIIAQGKEIRPPQETISNGMDSHPETMAEKASSARTVNLRDMSFLKPAIQPDEIGRLGGYRVLEVLGSGGMGVVFRAEDPRLNRTVALKAMKPAIASDESAKQRFLREAQATAAIEHDHIVSIYQVDEDGGIPFIAMRFLRGESLRTRLKKGPLPQHEVLRIGGEIALGLSAAHQQGLIHRDIKPDNIFLEEPSDRVKIVDFGLVRNTRGQDTDLTQMGMVLGTPKYMAPEQAQGQLVDFRCDLFSLGSVLYHLASGRAPFEGRSIEAILIAVATQDPPPLKTVCPNLDPQLAELIMQLLSKDRKQRPQSALEVVRRLEDIQQRLESTFEEKRRLYDSSTSRNVTPGHDETRAEPQAEPRLVQDLKSSLPDSSSDSFRRMLAQRSGMVALAVLVLSGLFLWRTGFDRSSTPDRVAADSTADSGERSPMPRWTAKGTGKRDMLLLVDSSGSMAGTTWEGVTKLEVTQHTLGKWLEQMPDDLNLGLLTFGQSASSENSPAPDNVDLWAPAYSPAEDAINSQLQSLKAQGTTSLARVLLKSANMLEPLGSGRQQALVIVTDGWDNRDGDPTQLGASLRKLGLKLNLYLIGLDLTDTEQHAFQSLTEAVGGQFLKAKDALDLEQALHAVHQQFVVDAPKANETIEIKNTGPGKIQFVNGSGRFYAVPFLREDVWIESGKIGSDFGLTMSEFWGLGVRILKVSRESPAAQAGFLAGDLIVQVDDTPTKTKTQLEELMGKAQRVRVARFQEKQGRVEERDGKVIHEVPSGIYTIFAIDVTFVDNISFARNKAQQFGSWLLLDMDTGRDYVSPIVRGIRIHSNQTYEIPLDVGLRVQHEQARLQDVLRLIESQTNTGIQMEVTYDSFRKPPFIRTVPVPAGRYSLQWRRKDSNDWFPVIENYEYDGKKLVTLKF